ncbi:MAG: hypothetical protein ACP5JG_16705 [Anaerolineae bacterium]
MSDLLLVVIATSIVILAVAAVWIEERIRARQDDHYMAILREHPHYRAHRRKHR